MRYKAIIVKITSPANSTHIRPVVLLLRFCGLCLSQLTKPLHTGIASIKIIPAHNLNFASSSMLNLIYIVGRGSSERSSGGNDDRMESRLENRVEYQAAGADITGPYIGEWRAQPGAASHIHF